MDVTEATFAHDVIEASHEQPVIVDFWAPWCGPCRVLGPVLERVVDEYGGAVRLTKVNTDDNPSLSAAFDIRGIPAVMAFVDGQMVDAFTGAIGEPGVRAFVAALASSPHAQTLDEARRLLEQGSFAEAREALTRIPFSDAARREADRLLARVELAEAAAALPAASGEPSGQPAPPGSAETPALGSAETPAPGSAETPAPGSGVAGPPGSADADELELQLALRELASGDLDGGLGRALQVVARRGSGAEKARELALLAFRSIEDPDVLRRWQGRLSAVLF